MTDKQSFGRWMHGSDGQYRLTDDALWQVEEPHVPTVPLKEVFGVLRRHVRLILVVTVLTVLPVFWLTYLRAPEYEARALIRLADARRAISGGLETVTDGEPIGRFTDELLSHIQVLQGRTVLGQVVDREGLRLVRAESSVPFGLLSEVQVAETAAPDTFNIRFLDDAVLIERDGVERREAYGARVDLGEIQFTLPSAAPALRDEALAVVTRDEAVDFVIEHLRASPRASTDVIDVVFTARDSTLAQRVVNSVVQVFQSFDMQSAQEQSSRRRAFLEAQLQQIDSAHARALDELSSFRAENQFYFSEGRIGDQQQSLVSLDERWEEVAASHRMHLELLNTILRADGEEQERAFRTFLASPEIAANPAISQLYAQLVRYQAERDELLAGPLGRTPESPDVRRIDSLIAGTWNGLLDAARSHVTSLGARLESIDELRSRSRARAQPLPALEATEGRLMERVASLGRTADQLRSELQLARMAEAVEAGRVQIIDLAPGSVPNQSNGPLKLALGLVLGLFLGAGGAFAAEAVNTSIRRPRELSNLLQVPQLAVIPKIATAPGGLERLTAIASPRSRRLNGRRSALVPAGAGLAAASAYRTLRANLMFSARAGTLRTLVITSACPSEGKTTTAANLAGVFALQGLRVLLIDTDLRNPRLHKVFSVEQVPGLSDVLTGACSLEDVVRATPQPELRMIPAGTRSEHATELLSFPHFREMLWEVRDGYDLVILDTPPVLAAPDSAILAAEADGVLMVVRAGQTERGAAEEAMQQLSFAGARVVGAVLNDPDAQLPSYGSYYSAYTYGH